MEKISFTREGVKCAAYLGIPEAKNGARLPAIVLGHDKYSWYLISGEARSLT
jgi:hypothetical protein